MKQRILPEIVSDDTSIMADKHVVSQKVMLWNGSIVLCCDLRGFHAGA